MSPSPVIDTRHPRAIGFTLLLADVRQVVALIALPTDELVRVRLPVRALLGWTNQSAELVWWEAVVESQKNE